jgi:hypothetical protein
MKRAKRGLTRIGTFGEELPNIENRIEPVNDKDKFGMPLAKIIHSYDKDAEAVWNANRSMSRFTRPSRSSTCPVGASWFISLVRYVPRQAASHAHPSFN